MNILSKKIHVEMNTWGIIFHIPTSEQGAGYHIWKTIGGQWVGQRDNQFLKKDGSWDGGKPDYFESPHDVIWKAQGWGEVVYREQALLEENELCGEQS